DGSNREAQAFPPEELYDYCRQGHDKRFGAEAEQEPPGDHDRRASRGNDEDRPQQAERGENQDGAPGSHAIDDHPADQNHDDVRNTIDAVQEAKLRIRKMELLAENVGNGADGVVNVVVAEDGNVEEPEDEPAVCRGRCFPYAHGSRLFCRTIISAVTWTLSKKMNSACHLNVPVTADRPDDL